MTAPARWRGLRPWRPLLGALALGAAALWAVVHVERRLDVDGAVVGATVEGCGPACADGWVRALGERLERAGLRVTRTPAEGAPVVALHIEPTQEVEGVEADALLLRAEVRLATQGEGDAPRLSLEAEGANREDALLSIALAALDARGDALVAELLTRPGLADPAAVRSLTRADALRRTLRVLPDHAEDGAAFRARCAEADASVAPEGDRVSCSTLCAGEVSVVRTAEGDAASQLRPAAWALPLDSSHDVQRVDLTGSLSPLHPQGPDDGGVEPIAIGSHVSEATGSGHGTFAFVAYHERASAVVLVGGGRRVLARASTPGVLASPAPSPSGRWVAYLAAEHRRGVPHLKVVPAAGGASRDLSNYVEALRWVRLGDRELLLARVSGAELATSPLAATAAGDGSDGGDGSDEAEGFEDEEDEFDLVEAGDPEAPPGAYAALVDPEDGRILARVAGRERVVVDAIGVAGRELVLTYRQAGDGGCGLLWHDLDSGEERTLPLAVCLEDPVLLRDGRVAASAPVTSPGDPAAGDRELVLVSAGGELEVLTANATDDVTPSPVGPSELAFTRLLPKHYTRFPVSAACRVRVPARASSTAGL